jgi:hypothetical protein
MVKGPVSFYEVSWQSVTALRRGNRYKRALCFESSLVLTLAIAAVVGAGTGDQSSTVIYSGQYVLVARGGRIL